MALLISAKNRDIGNWRAAGEFAADFRDALLGQTANLLSDDAESLFLDVEKTLEEGAAAHDQALLRMREMMVLASRSSDPAVLKKIVKDFQAEIICFFSWNRSATAYFRLQAEFYEAIASAVVKISRQRAGLSDTPDQPLALIALGDGGRAEFSLKDRLKLLLICDERITSERMAVLGETLHSIFDESGLLLDDTITPRHAAWRSTKNDLLARLTNSTKSESADALHELINLVNQRVLYNENELATGVRDECLKLLSGSRRALLIMVERLHTLSSGIGLMGGIKLEKSGPGRGKFRLYHYALQPLSCSVTVLSLLKGEMSLSTPERIRGLLSKGNLDVETAERLLNAWHNFNEHRAALESQNHIEGFDDELYLDYAAMGEQAQDDFKYYLETTAALLRHVIITFNNWEESR